MAKHKDADIVDAARFVALKEANEWIGLPFDLRGALLSLREAPRKIRESVREEGIVGWIIGCLILLALAWFLAPLRQALVQLELALAMLYINIWLFFLPFILIGAGLYFLNLLWMLAKRPTMPRAKVVSRAGIRFVLLASTFLIDVYWGEAIRAFVSGSKAMGLE